MTNEKTPDKSGVEKKLSRTFSLYSGDLVLIEWIGEQLGAGRSPVVEMAVQFSAEILRLAEDG